MDTPPGSDIEVRRAHADYLQSGQPEHVRTVVADSWIRSSAAGLDPESHLAPVLIDAPELRDYREAHPLSPVFPLLYDVLGRAAVDCDCVMAVGDADGRLLWVCGSPSTLRRAESINFVEGSAWDEHNAGTNAPGTALHLDSPVQIRAAEHFTRLVQPWSCSAAPIHDPLTHRILGLVDITGGEDVASPQTLAMVRAAARMAESELARMAWEGRPAPRLWTPDGARPRLVLQLRGLGLPDMIAELDGRSVRLSRRHSEIVAVLVDHPDGLTAEQLEVEVYEGRVQSSTMRAEMTRLRALLGNDVLASRPYRLAVETDCDWKATAAHVAAGRLREALRAYRGPLLPSSDSPGVASRREELQRQLRAAVIASGEADLMAAWTRSHWGADDREMWARQAEALPPSSPLAPIARAEARRLEAEQG